MMKPTDDKTIPSNGQAPTSDDQPNQEAKPEQGTPLKAAEPVSADPKADAPKSEEAKADAPKAEEVKPEEPKASATKPPEKADEPKLEIDDRPTIALSGVRPSAPPLVPPTPAPAAPAPVPAVPAPTTTPSSGMAMPGMSKPIIAPIPDAPPADAVKPADSAAQPTAEAKPAEEAKADGDSPKRPKKPIDPTQAHVLVVEDNVPNFVLIARMLAYMGVQRCEWKTSGWQVVEFADTLPRIDLILMDIRLPYEDGFQALEKVRANQRLKDTLVVAVTAEASVDQMKRAQESGFDGFLSKPLDPDRFPEQIRRVLNGESVWEIH
jgi:two-component system, cell cycle response regulator DivK